MITLALLILLALGSAWEEVQQLIQRGSWLQKDYWDKLFWETNQVGRWKLFDSHHVAFGFFILILSLCLFFIKLTHWWMIPLVWVVFFWLRNIFMHIVFKKEPLWKYLLPLA